jgi:hypothetical protein
MPPCAMGWQKAASYNRRASAETAVRRCERAIGDALRSRTDPGQATELAIDVARLIRAPKSRDISKA